MVSYKNYLDSGDIDHLSKRSLQRLKRNRPRRTNADLLRTVEVQFERKQKLCDNSLDLCSNNAQKHEESFSEESEIIIPRNEESEEVINWMNLSLLQYRYFKQIIARVLLLKL
ncbi:hypothetical protein TKK_0009836 [Trichogramma kaykai]